jgi:hypothetical protein
MVVGAVLHRALLHTEHAFDELSGGRERTGEAIGGNG